MIDIEKLTEKDVGRWAWYRPQRGSVERGRIKTWNQHNIFVVYNCNHEWKRFEDYTSNATRPEDLEFIEHESHCKADGGFMCSCGAPDVTIYTESLTDKDGVE